EMQLFNVVEELELHAALLEHLVERREDDVAHAGGHLPAHCALMGQRQSQQTAQPDARASRRPQWSDVSRQFFATVLPFVKIVPSDHVWRQIHYRGSPQLAILARDYWFVFKTCIGLLCPP